MRCNKCNVDLGENYTTCPLCGEKAVNEEPRLKGLKVAPYPTEAIREENPKADKPRYSLSAERLKAFFNA